jgi:threonine/homoserine/homoserine lactone efflux protein
MIPIEVLLAFLAASALITIAPGPDNLMVLSVGISRGRAAGIGFGLGCALGCFTHTLWATLGIGAVVLASEGHVHHAEDGGGRLPGLYRHHGLALRRKAGRDQAR